MTTLRTGARTPFFASDITDYHDLTSGDFSPIEDMSATPTLAELSACDVFIKNGFLVQNASSAGGLISVITWTEFQIHRSQSNKSLVDDEAVLALCTPVSVYTASGDFVLTPVVKVFATDDQTSPSVIETIGIGTIR